MIKKNEAHPVKACDENIRSTLKLTEKMIALATKGYSECEDIQCGILYGILLDSAYKMKKIAEDEKKAHISKGWWEERS